MKFKSPGDMLTQNNSVLSGKLVGQITSAKNTEPSTKFKNRDQPSLGAWIVGCGRHSIIEGRHTKKANDINDYYQWTGR